MKVNEFMGMVQVLQGAYTKLEELHNHAQLLALECNSIKTEIGALLMRLSETDIREAAPEPVFEEPEVCGGCLSGVCVCEYIAAPV